MFTRDGAVVAPELLDAAAVVDVAAVVGTVVRGTVVLPARWAGVVTVAPDVELEAPPVLPEVHAATSPTLPRTTASAARREREPGTTRHANRDGPFVTRH